MLASLLFALGAATPLKCGGDDDEDKDKDKDKDKVVVHCGAGDGDGPGEKVRDLMVHALPAELLSPPSLNMSNMDDIHDISGADNWAYRCTGKISFSPPEGGSDEGSISYVHDCRGN